MRLISYSISGGAVALGFSGFLHLFHLSSYFYIPVAGILIVILSIVYYLGLRIGSDLEKIFVSINVAGLIIFIVTGFLISKFRVSHFEPFVPHGVSGIVESASLAFFAYSGLNTIATLTPDVKDGERNVPKAIILSLIITAVSYILVVFTMLLMLPWYAYGTQPDTLTFALEKARAPLIISSIISLVGLLSTLTVTLSMIIAGVRTLQQMAKDELLSKRLGEEKLALSLTSGVMIASLFLGNVEAIGLASIFGTVFSYITTPVASIISERRGIKGKFKIPLSPITQIFSVILSLIIIASLGDKALVIDTLTLLVGLLLHEIHIQVNIVEKGKTLNPHGLVKKTP